MKAATAKVKKSYSLSQESEQYVRRYRRMHKIASDSEALDTLLQSVLAAERLEEISLATVTYYDQLDAHDLRQQSDLAALSLATLGEIPWND